MMRWGRGGLRMLRKAEFTLCRLSIGYKISAKENCLWVKYGTKWMIFSPLCMKGAKAFSTFIRTQAKIFISKHRLIRGRLSRVLE
jgi:hypothetical protein